MSERIQLSRRKGWRKPEGAVIVSRPSRWGNPFPVKQWGLDLSLRLYNDLAQGVWSPGLLAAESDERFNAAYAARAAWLQRLGGHPLELVRELHGHDLACWCPLDQGCHADVLLDLANGGNR